MTRGLSDERCLGDLPRVDGAGFEERLRAGAREPVVVLGLAERWPAAELWTHAYVLAKLGMTSLPDGGIGCALGEELSRDVAFPPILRSITQANVWLFADESRSGLHCDPPHNLNTVLRGEKEWIVLAPRERANVYPGSPFGGLGPCNSRVDLDASSGARFPRIRRAQFWRTTVKAGETLYLPPWFWHFVRSRGESVAVNVWFHRERSRLIRALSRPLSVNVAAALGILGKRGKRADAGRQ